MASTSSSALRRRGPAVGLGVAAALALTVAYERAWASPAVLVAAALLAAAGANPRALPLALAAFGGAFALVCGRFVPVALSRHGDVGVPGGVAVLVALALVEATRFGVAGWLAAGLARRLPPAVVAGAAIVVAESLVPSPLGWAFAAPLARFAAASGALAWLGAPVVGGALVAVAGLRRARGPAVASFAAASLLGIPALLGRFDEVSRVRVGLLQEPEREGAHADALAELEAARRVGELAQAGAAFVVRAEGVVPGVVPVDGVAARVAASVPVVAGAVLHGTPLPTNSLVVVAGGRVTHRYDKVDLVPLSEGVPRWATFVRAPRFAPGTGPRVATVVGVPVELTVCFEGALPTEGAAALRVNAADDGWFAGTRGGEAHFLLARLRAAEGARSLVRATRTGITAVVDGKGRVLEALSEGVTAHAVVEVPLGRPGASPAQAARPFVAGFALLLAALGVWLGRNGSPGGTTRGSCRPSP